MALTKPSKTKRTTKPDDPDTRQGGRRQFLIQIEQPSKKLDLAQIYEILAGTGVEVDKGYGPINVNPKLGRYVVRGWATSDARARAEKIQGVRFFGDPKIAPMGPPR